MSGRQDYFLKLCHLWCEQQISEPQVDELRTLMLSEPAMQQLFLQYVQLHGQLSWDAGLMTGSELDRSSREELNELAVARKNITQPAPQRRRWMPILALASVTLLIFTGIGTFTWRDTSVHVVSSGLSNDAVRETVQGTGALSSLPVTVEIRPDLSKTSVSEPLKPLELAGLVPAADAAPASDAAPAGDATETRALPAAIVDDTFVIAEIDRLISAGWAENRIVAAEPADDYEWVRRCYLTLTGRIPTVSEVSTFVEKQSPRKRTELIDTLLTDQRFAENLSVTWMNLLIGRSNPRKVDADALYSFLNRQFLQNRSWMETVGDLIAAEGRSDQNGATNFLLAHLNDQATPATAVTARLFLGQQVHCTQCHSHPFVKERHQDEFWSLNAFFKQAERKSLTLTAADGSPRHVWSLKDSGASGMTFYETLRGQQKATLPEFAGHAMSPDDRRPRRAELVKLLAEDNRNLVAQAMVNRTWAQVFGYGFTNPVDDLGPHNPVSHPELLNYLTQTFVDSDYDVQRLIRWMTLSRTFQLSSVQDEPLMALDVPEHGGPALFSRAYPRPMGPEQVYDSIRIAIRSAANQPIDSSIGTAHRREWVEQFVQSYGTDENDEQLAFEGNITQALLMMNGEDIQAAIPLAAAEVTGAVQQSTEALQESLERIAMATLNREPSDQEQKVFRGRYRILSRSYPAEQAIRTATEDMLWAYLNSSEFTSVH